MPKVTEITIKGNMSENREFELPEPGVYLARCYKIVDEGTHLDPVKPGSQYEAKPTRRVHIHMELLEDEVGDAAMMKSGKPFSISKRYTMSTHEKSTLRADLENWRGKKYSQEELANFKITDILGKFALIQVSHNPSADGSKTYANISSFMATKKSPSTAENELVSFSVAAPDMEVWATLSPWMQERINSSDEMKGRELPVTVRDDFNKPEPVETPAAKKAATSVAEDLDAEGL